MLPMLTSAPDYLRTRERTNAGREKMLTEGLRRSYVGFFHSRGFSPGEFPRLRVLLRKKYEAARELDLNYDRPAVTYPFFVRTFGPAE